MHSFLLPLLLVIVVGLGSVHDGYAGHDETRAKHPLQRKRLAKESKGE